MVISQYRVVMSILKMTMIMVEGRNKDSENGGKKTTKKKIMGSVVEISNAEFL